MRSIEDKGCYNFATTTTNDSNIQQNGMNRAASQHHHHHRSTVPLGKPTPSKWDDAQKWLVGTLSRGGGDPKTKPRNSNADDTRLIAPPVPQKEDDLDLDIDIDLQVVETTKKVDNCDHESSVWRVNNKHKDGNSKSTAVRSICVRDMGTEMTPIASLEPSRTGTPIRSTTPANLSPMASGSSSPVRCGVHTTESRGNNDVLAKVAEGENLEQGIRKLSPLETRAIAWDEAERAKYTARYKREEVRIEAWENHEKRKAEMEIKRMEVKAERLKTRSQEKLANKLAAITRIAEEKRTNAEAELNEKAVRTSERADYIRRTGRLPSSFSFKWPSLCCHW